MKSEKITIYAGYGQDEEGRDREVTGYSLSHEGAKLSTKGKCWGEFGNVRTTEAVRFEDGTIHLLGRQISLVEDQSLIEARRKELLSKLSVDDIKILGIKV